MGVVKCSSHPDRFSTGVCARCKLQVCDLCNVDVGGARYCSIVCFTEQALEEKGKKLAQKAPDPLADLMLKDDSSVVLPAATAQPSDDSSLQVSEHQDDATSILDMEALKQKLDESSIAPMEGRMKEPTSILGMHELAVRKPDGTWLDEPPRTETPLPILLPGTRRSTIESRCVFHADTPAVVLCTKCGDAICTMCIQDEDHGGRCSPACRRDLAKAGRKKLLLVAGGIAIAMMIAAVALSPGGKKSDTPIETPEQFAARSREAERVRLEAAAAEDARLRVEAREKEEREKAEAAVAEIRRVKEAEVRAKAAEEARLAAIAKAELEAKEALAKAEAEAKLKAEALAKAEAEAKAKADAARAAEEADRKAKAAARAKMEAEAVAKAETERKAKAEAEAKMKAEADAKAAKAKAEADAKAKAEAEAKAKAEMEAKAKSEAEKAKVEAEAKAKAEAEARAKAEAEAKAAAVANSFNRVSALIREATPEFRALADDSVPLGQAALPRIDAVISKLSDARATYLELLNDANDRALVERRIAILGDLVATLRNSRARAAEAR